MRVLCIDHEGGYGGSSRSLFRLIEAMDRDAIEIEVWCGRAGPVQDRYSEIGVKVRVIPGLPSATTIHRVSRTIFGFARCLWRLASDRRLQREMASLDGYDLIHFNHPNLFLLAGWIKRNTSGALSLHVRTVSEDLYEGTPEGWLARAVNRQISAWLASWQMRRLAATIDGFVFITENEAEAFQRLASDVAGTVIYNVTTTSGAPPARDPRIPEDCRLKVASLENYRWSRGTDRLVEIASVLAAAGRDDVLFVIAGDMNFSRAQRRGYGIGYAGCSNLMEYVRRAGLARYFLFLGHVSDPETILDATDLLISLPRRSGPWGRNVIEAMASERPVLTIGEWDGFVKSGHTGILHETFEASAFAESLIELAQDREHVHRLGVAARKHIATCCDASTNARRLHAFWQKTVDATHGAGL